MPMVIAIDGPAASGKGTLARRLAKHFNLAHLESGLLYRAVAQRMLRHGRDPKNATEAEDVARRIGFADLSDPALREEAVSTAASVVSAHPAVRAALMALQREFAAHPPAGTQGVVIDGRDIGTVICPDADVKIYVTASPEVRARRRAAEYQAQGRKIDETAVLADIIKRDERDSNRAAAPLRQAPDAYLLDTTHLAIDPAIRAAIDIVEATRAGRGRN